MPRLSFCAQIGVREGQTIGNSRRKSLNRKLVAPSSARENTGSKIVFLGSERGLALKRNRVSIAPGRGTQKISKRKIKASDSPTAMRPLPMKPAQREGEQHLYLTKKAETLRDEKAGGESKGRKVRTLTN